MRYIVYLDRLFLLQAVQTMVLLLLTGTFLRGFIPGLETGLLRIILGSGAEALFFCAIFLIPGVDGRIKTLILAAGSAVLPAAVFRVKNFRFFLRTIILYHGSAFLMGGIFYAFLGAAGKALAEHTISASVCVILIAITVLAVWSREGAGKENSLVNVELVEGNIRIIICALIDSGNTLYDPISAKPVSIVERAVLEGRVSLSKPEKYRLVPYHTLGSRGLMQAIQIDRMIIRQDGQDVQVEKPLLGIYDSSVTQTGSYQMILHPELLKKKRKLFWAAEKRKYDT